VITGDFYNYFRILNTCDFFEGCLLQIFSDKMRVAAVRSFAKSQLNLPLEYLRDLLYFDKLEDVIDYLESLGYKNLKEIKNNI
jgi:hypothetical protein